MSAMSMLIIAVVLVVILFAMFPRLKRFYLRVRLEYLGFRVALNLNKLKNWRVVYDSPKKRLERAQKAVCELRAGFWLNSSENRIYLNPDYIKERIRYINEALETDFSYKQIGTTREEVIGFRNGEAHKTAARLLVELSRTLSISPRDNDIIRLVEDADFTLEEVGTSEAELKSLHREYYRRICESLVNFFRQWAIGASDVQHENADKFEEDISGYLSPEPEGHGFSYEELGTSEAECAELIRLARRREVVRSIDYFRSEAERGHTDSPYMRENIQETLAKAGLTLSDFNITETDLDEIDRSAYVNKAMSLLGELRVPGEGWFYSKPVEVSPNIRFYLPALSGHIPGDPLYFVRKIQENLASADATLSDIGTSDAEIETLVRAGHIASARFILGELQRISKIPRVTNFQRTMSMLGPNQMFIDDPSNPVDRTTLEDPYPVERDIQAIEYHLKGAEISLEDVGNSEQQLQELRIAVEAR